MACSADQIAEDIRKVPRAFGLAMDRATNDVARGDQKLNQKRCGVGFRVRLDQLYKAASKSMKSRLVQRLGPRISRCGGFFVARRFRLLTR